MLLLYWRDPATASIFPVCPFHALTGLDCPGCGSLRAMHQLLHGNLLAALRLNPLVVLSLPLLAYCGLADFVGRTSGYRLPPGRGRAGYIWLLLAVIVAFWFFRNIPCYPFTLLGPG